MRAFARAMASHLLSAGEVLPFLWKRRLWWAIPMVSLLLVFAILLVFASSSGLGPIIYPLF